MSRIKLLKEVLLQSDAVIFIGSGLSRWSGLPSWLGLVQEIAAYLDRAGIDSDLVRAEARSGDLLQAASYGFAKLTKPQIAQFIRRATRSGEAVPVEIHRKIITLGPTCFITTNYDDLLEQAFARWMPEQPKRRLVTNRQLVEQAEIVHAQARNFIFKPHGDAHDAETIVLTREQYRMLLPEGEYSATLTTLKTLLASRPVLFVGFGLRDPDFLYVRDLLLNIYRGGVRDHFAITSDPTEEQIDYWRRSYGVHLIGYKVSVRGDGSEDHSALLELLNELQGGQVAESSPVLKANLEDAMTVLSLARYGASFSSEVSSLSKFTIIVRKDRQRPPQGIFQFLADSQDSFDRWHSDKFLLKGPSRAILRGAPGAGKTFSMRNAARVLAVELQEACIQSSLSNATVVPLLFDLKLYNGNLLKNIEEAFPPGLSLEKLYEVVPIRLFLDAFNEMPREHLESDKFLNDIQNLLAEYPKISVIIGSRSIDGLEKLNFPAYELSEIPKVEVQFRLKSSGITIPEKKLEDVIAILQRPFYFQLLTSSAVGLQSIASPADLYVQFIRHFEEEFAKRFDFDVVGILRVQAYRTLERGTEAFSLDELRDLVANTSRNIDTDTVINWIVGRQLIVPLVGARGRFAHQSITEYLAATELANRLQAGVANLASILELRRWDHTIHLTLSLLPEMQAESLLRELVRVDLRFAINGARFLEHRQSEIIERLLATLAGIDDGEFDMEVDHAFSKLHFSLQHEGALRALVARRGRIGRAALFALTSIVGVALKSELMTLLFDDIIQRDALSEAAARSLASLVDVADVREIVEQVRLTPVVMQAGAEESETTKRIRVAAQALHKVPLEVLRVELFAKIDDSAGGPLLAELFCEIKPETECVDRFLMLNELVVRKHRCAIFPTYLIIKFWILDEELPLHQIDDEYLNFLNVVIEEGNSWATELLFALCRRDAEIAFRLNIFAATQQGLVRAILLYCASGNAELIFAELERLASGSTIKIEERVFFALDFKDLDWKGREALFVKLLDRKYKSLAKPILGGSIPVEIRGLDKIDMGHPRRWLDWILELKGDEDWWLMEQLGYLVARSTYEANAEILISYLGDPDSAFRKILSRMVLPYANALSTEHLPPSAIDYLLSELRQKGASHVFRPHLLGIIATEAFIEDQLLPMCRTESSVFRDNVKELNSHAGRRYGRRFLLPPSG